MVNNQQTIINRIHKLLSRHFFTLTGVDKEMILLLLLMTLLCNGIFNNVTNIS